MCSGLEKRESYTIDIYEGSMLLKTAQATLGVASLQTDGSEIFMAFHCTPKMGFLGKIVDVVMIIWSVSYQA